MTETALILFLFSLVFVLLFSLWRIEWVYRVRIRWICAGKYHLLEKWSFSEMNWTFWIWDHEWYEHRENTLGKEKGS
jgi:hypothetical protein